MHWESDIRGHLHSHIWNSVLRIMAGMVEDIKRAQAAMLHGRTALINILKSILTLPIVLILLSSLTSVCISLASAKVWPFLKLLTFTVGSSSGWGLRYSSWVQWIPLGEHMRKHLVFLRTAVLNGNAPSLYHRKTRSMKSSSLFKKVTMGVRARGKQEITNQLHNCRHNHI